MTDQPRNFSFTGFLKAARFPNLIIVIMAQYLAAFYLIEYAGPESLFDLQLFLLSFSTVIIAAGGYLINDYYDIKIDFINRPERVIVGRVLKRRVIMVAHTILNFTGIGIGFILMPAIGIIHFLSATLLWLYSNQLKRLPFIGNFTIGVLTGASILVIGLMYGEFNNQLIAYASFAFFFNMLREIFKDMEDVKGDLAFGCRTLPIALGFRKTKIFVFVLSSVFILILIPAILTDFSLNFRIVLGAISLATVFINYRLYLAHRRRDFGRLSFTTKVIMFFGILSILTLDLALGA